MVMSHSIVYPWPHSVHMDKGLPVPTVSSVGTTPPPAPLMFQHNPYSFYSVRQMVPTESSSSSETYTHISSPTTSVAGSLRGSECSQSHTSFPTLHVQQHEPVMMVSPFAHLITAPPMIGTLHASLAASHVPFVPYPSVAATMAAQEMLSPETPPFADRAITSQFNEADCEALLQADGDIDEEDEVATSKVEAKQAALELEQRKRCGIRLFLGQLPMYVTGDQVAWIVETVTGRRVFGTEAIHSWGKAAGCSGNKGRPRSPTTANAQQPKGCVHTYCDTEDDVQCIVELLGKRSRVLVDDTGIFIATTEAEQYALFSYCETMAKDVHKRFPLRPFRPVVAQRATSTFVPVTVTAGTASTVDIAQQPGGRAIVAGPGGAVVQAPPPYYSCAVERFRQEATLPRQPVVVPAVPPPPPPVVLVPYDPNGLAPAPSFRRGNP